MKSQSIILLGSTGSIGQNTLKVIKDHPERFAVFALVANKQVDLIISQCIELEPRYVFLANTEARLQCKTRLKALNLETILIDSETELLQLMKCTDVDTVVSAMVGAVGLLPTLSALQAGKKVLLANKESLVMAGQLFMQTARSAKATILPIDSEHNAIFQCLADDQGQFRCGMQSLTLTASGGPFRKTPLDQLAYITPEQACQHPNWQMGPKISVDSATMMNKGLELIETGWLFGVGVEQIDVVIHPQSVIHSIVNYVDGSSIAQLGYPDMRVPIAHCLAWPERVNSGVNKIDLIKMSRLDFEAVDYKRFPNLQLAKKAYAEGLSAPTVLNAANEVAVAAFLNREIQFMQIAEVNQAVLDQANGKKIGSIEEVLLEDQQARTKAKQIINIIRTLA